MAGWCVVTSPDVPVGACGDAAPAGDTLNAVAYARGVLQVETETLRHELRQAASEIENLVAAVASEESWKRAAAVHRAHLFLNHLKDHP